MAKKVILLSRVSTVGQELMSQTDKLKQEALRTYSEKDIIVIENKESAVKKSEEELLGINEMKEYITTGQIQAVYCYELSRLSRRPKVLYSLRDYFLEHKVQLIVLNPYFKLLDDNGNLNESSNIIFALYSSFAEQEARQLKERTLRGKLKNRDSGKFVGGKDLFGYSHDKDKNYIINEIEADIVREIFNMYAGGESKLGIARIMRSRGYFLNFQSAIDCHTHIDNILHNRDYCGEHNKPRIISDDLFELVQSKFPVKKRRVKTKRLALGRSFLFNPYCKTKRKLFYVNTKNNDYFSYLDNKETRIYIKIGVVDALTWYVVKKHYCRFISAFPKLSADTKNQNKNAMQDKIKVLTEEINELNESVQRIEERIVFGKLKADKAEQLEKVIEKQIAAKRQQIEELTTALESVPVFDVNTDIDSLSDDEKCKLVKQLFMEIHLYRDKKYYWNMDFWLDNETCEHYMIYTRNPDYYILNGEDKTKIEL